MTMIQIITNDDEHERALREIDRLWSSTAPDEIAALQALVLLTSCYEEKRWPIKNTLDPIDMIKHAMSPDVGHTKLEFVEMIGSPAGASQVLARKRPLTLDMIRRISERWGIAIDLLTPAYKLDMTKPKPATTAPVPEVAPKPIVTTVTKTGAAQPNAGKAAQTAPIDELERRIVSKATGRKRA